MSRNIPGVKCPLCGQETLIVNTRFGYAVAISCRRRTCGFTLWFAEATTGKRVEVIDTPCVVWKGK